MEYFKIICNKCGSIAEYELDQGYPGDRYGTLRLYCKNCNLYEDIYN